MPTFSDLKEHFSKHKGKYISGAVLGTIGLGSARYHKLKRDRERENILFWDLNNKYSELMSDQETNPMSEQEMYRKLSGLNYI